MSRVKYFWHWYRFKWFYFIQGLTLTISQNLMEKIDAERAGVEANRWWE